MRRISNAQEKTQGKVTGTGQLSFWNQNKKLQNLRMHKTQVNFRANIANAALSYFILTY